jgi:hypothetical protein
MYGHHGLEPPSACKRRFREQGFVPMIERSDYCKGVVRPPDSYKVFFGAPGYRRAHPLFAVLAAGSALCSSNILARSLAGIALYSLTAINRLWGPDGVDSVKLLYRKRTAPRPPTGPRDAPCDHYDQPPGSGWSAPANGGT